MEKQKVIITGIGPGDPELLTVKAYNAIKSADVIVYDSEQADQILNLAPKNTEIVKINKDRSKAYNEVANDIIDLIEECYLENKKVVRLKVGDAFLFGRGGTEAIKMKSRGIDFEVIPGITSGIAAANLSKIKISEKGEADGVVFYMANQKDDQQDNIKSIADNLKNGFTLVAYMAEHRIKKLVELLINNRVSPEFSIVAITNISVDRSKIRSGVLNNVLNDNSWNEIEPQTTFFIGEFVGLI